MTRDSLPVGVVLERREIDNPWQSHSWHSVEVIPGAPPVKQWRKLGEGEGWTRYHAATLEVELFVGETEGYRYNLSNAMPAVYVVLRPNDEGETDVEPFLATVCPYEAQDYQESADETVDPVPMPDDMIAWVGRFVDQHHVEVPFHKRKRKPHKQSEGRPPDQRRGGG